MKTLYNLFILVVMLALPRLGNAQTEVAGGTITGKKTWSLSGSPYNINGDIIIQDNSSLVIEPGVEVNVNGEYYIRVEGEINAVGTKDDNIIFSAVEGTNWKGLKIARAPGNDSTLLKYVTVTDSDSSGIAISNSDSVLIEHCKIIENSTLKGGGISIGSSTVSIVSCYFNDCSTTAQGYGGAIYASNSTVNIINSVFNENTSTYGGACAFTNSTVKLINNTFANCSASYGGAIFDYDGTVKSYNNIYWKNTSSYNRGENVAYYGTNAFHSHDAFSECSSCTSIYTSGSTVTYTDGSYEATNKTINTENSGEDAPYFESASGENFKLTSQSFPLINKGDTTGISQYLPQYDYAGEERILYNKIDRGAFEFNYSGVLSTVTSVTQGNGSISPTGDSTVSYFDAIDYTITPNNGEELISVQYNGTDITAELTDKSTYYTYTLDSVAINSTFTAVFTEPFTVTASATGSGSISPEGDSIVDFFDEIVYTITPDADEILLSAEYNGTDIFNMLTGNGSYYTYKLDSVTKDSELIIGFSEDKTITASAGEHGTISPQGEIEIGYGLSKEFQFEPDEGYVVSKLLIDGKQVPFIGYSYTLDSVISSLSIHVEFEEFNGRFSFYADKDAVIQSKESTPDIADKNAGDIQTMLLLDSEYGSRNYNQVLFHFSGIEDVLNKFNISDDSIESAQLKLYYSSTGSYYHIGNNAFNAYWYDTEWTEDTVTWNNAPEITDASLYVNHPKSVSNIQDYTIDFSDLFFEQYDKTSGTAGFRCILTDGVAGSRQQVSLASKENSDSTLWPKIEIKLKGTYLISSSATEGGTITPAGDSIVHTCDEIIYTITPNEGYGIASANYNGASIMNDLVNNESNYTYSLTNITKDGNLEVNFADLYTVTASASEGGSIAPEGDSTIVEGSSIVYTITPNSGYQLATAQYNGTSIMNNLVNNGSYYTYLLTNIAGDGNLEVSFVNVYTITASASEGGSVSPEGDSTVVEGSSIVYTITPNSGNQLATAQYNGASIMNDLVNNGSNYTYSLTNITGDGSLEVSFADLYTVTASASEGGSVSPEGDSTVVEGSSIIYTITPNSGYQLATAQYNGTSIMNTLVNQGSYYSYEVSNITQNGTLQITFSDIPDGIDNVTKEKLNIVPNPTTSIVDIPLRSGVNKASLSIYAITGNLVYHNPEFTGGLADLSVLQKGTYIVKINYGGTVLTSKLIKE